MEPCLLGGLPFPFPNGRKSTKREVLGLEVVTRDTQEKPKESGLHHLR